MTRYTLIADPNYGAGGTAEFRLHTADCRDIDRHIKSPMFGGSFWDVTGESPEKVIESELVELEGWSVKDFHICPCCKRKI